MAAPLLADNWAVLGADDALGRAFAAPARNRRRGPRARPDRDSAGPALRRGGPLGALRRSGDAGLRARGLRHDGAPAQAHRSGRMGARRRRRQAADRERQASQRHRRQRPLRLRRPFDPALSPNRGDQDPLPRGRARPFDVQLAESHGVEQRRQGLRGGARPEPPSEPLPLDLLPTRRRGEAVLNGGFVREAILPGEGEGAALQASSRSGARRWCWTRSSTSR